jgi:hypothetical protein
MAGTVLQAHDFALVELDEVRVPNTATASLPGRRVNLEFTGEVHRLPTAILAVEGEAQRRGGVLFPARIVSLVQQPAVLRYFVIVKKLLGQTLCLKVKVLRLGIGQTVAAANVVEQSRGKPPLESYCLVRLLPYCYCRSAKLRDNPMSLTVYSLCRRLKTSKTQKKEKKRAQIRAGWFPFS